MSSSLNKKIEYELNFKERKNIKIKVTPEKKVLIEAPLNSSIEKINGKINKRLKWINKQLIFFEQFHPLTSTRKYIGGETHLYLGKQYILKIKPDKVDNIEIIGNNLIVKTLMKNNYEKIKELIDKWYMNKAKILFNNYLSKIELDLKKYNIKSNKLIIKYLKKRWGSCSNKGTIILNVDLIKAPIHCIKYVIIHELCHIKHKKHDKYFYNFLEKLMPDWKKWKEKLELFMS